MTEQSAAIENLEKTYGRIQKARGERQEACQTIQQTNCIPEKLVRQLLFIAFCAVWADLQNKKCGQRLHT